MKRQSFGGIWGGCVAPYLAIDVWMRAGDIPCTVMRGRVVDTGRSLPRASGDVPFKIMSLPMFPARVGFKRLFLFAARPGHLVGCGCSGAGSFGEAFGLERGNHPALEWC